MLKNEGKAFHDKSHVALVSYCGIESWRVRWEINGSHHSLSLICSQSTPADGRCVRVHQANRARLMNAVLDTALTKAAGLGEMGTCTWLIFFKQNVMHYLHAACIKYDDFQLNNFRYSD